MIISCDMINWFSLSMAIVAFGLALFSLSYMWKSWQREKSVAKALRDRYLEQERSNWHDHDPINGDDDSTIPPSSIDVTGRNGIIPK